MSVEYRGGSGRIAIRLTEAWAGHSCPVHSLYILLIEESNPFASSCTAVDAAAARKDTDGGECGTAIGNV